MQHRPICYRQGQILRPTTAGILGEIDRRDPSCVVIAHIIVNAEIVALAGDYHIVVAVIAHLAGMSGQRCPDRTGHRKRVSLAFLAPKPTAHPADFHPHRMHRFADGMGNLVLYLGWVLGRGMDNHVPPFLRQGQCGLTLKIEMLLPAHFDGSA